VQKGPRTARQGQEIKDRRSRTKGHKTGTKNHGSRSKRAEERIGFNVFGIKGHGSRITGGKNGRNEKNVSRCVELCDKKWFLK